jgi:hypothetical protein
LLGINGVLDPPPDLAHLVSQHKSVSYFNKILTPGSDLISDPDVSNSTQKSRLFSTPPPI